MTDADPRYIYADNAATTPLSSRALQAMMPYLFQDFGNPSGIHRVARCAAESLSRARGDVARLLGAARAEEIYLTSGGSEADNWVLRGAVKRWRRMNGAAEAPHIVTSCIEHHAVLHCCQELEREGAQVTYLPVDDRGLVAPVALEAVLEANPNVALVSIMLANNEVGTIQPIRQLADVAHAHGVPMHTDAVQAVGHIPVNVQELGVDALSLSGHKFHGPRGIGALYLREGFSIPPLIAGGGQERGLRAGTENLAGAVGMAAALEEACQDLAERAGRITSLRERLVNEVVAEVPDVVATGADGPDRLPSIASFACRDVDGELLVVLLDRAGVAAATGSACSTGSTDPSHVISALGISDPRWAHGSLRLSLADDATAEDVAELCERVPRCIKRARLISGTAR